MGFIKWFVVSWLAMALLLAFLYVNQLIWEMLNQWAI
jgi:hypothetical protein